jgi:RNA methyltransferase, TrmH family
MIPLAKLAKLSPRHRLRKAALVLTELERELMAAGPGRAAAASGYAVALGSLLGTGAGSPESVLGPAQALASIDPRSPGSGAALLRAVDSLRHALFSATGQAPADWDLLDPATGRRDPGARLVIPGIKVYLEDLRSPFNVGTIFRTAEAFGVEEMILSPCCADPRHPRAERSSMGAVDLVPWRRADLGENGVGEGVFALELGGIPLESFVFPRTGLVIIGSEELGVSPEARARCDRGAVSIPMSGAKGSLNAAVAFGILMYSWKAGLGERASG